jgi:prepilin-type N-terminal cleavage/methylation domain-containing protein
MSPARSARSGFTLIEVLIAVVILGTIGVALSNSLAQGARRTVAAGAIGYRTAALNTEVSRVAALPSGTLTAGTTVRTDTTKPFPHTITTVIATSGQRQTVTITVTPTGARAIAAITRAIERTIGPTPSPFGS